VARDVAGRLVERIVQGGGAERGQGGEAAADRLAVLGEGHDAEVTAVEAGEGHLVLRRQRVEELQHGLVRARRLQLLVHAPARVHEQQQPCRQLPPAVEMGNRLRPALLVDPEVLPTQVRDRPALAVHRRR